MSGVSETASAVEQGTPSRTELVERAAALRALLRDDAGQGDRDRELTDRVIDAMTDAGLFKLMVPRHLGGYDAGVETLLDVVGELGRGDLSAGWVSGVMNFSAWWVRAFSDRAQRDVWESNPLARVCSVISPSAEQKEAEGGIVVSGRWPNSSGCTHSEWAVLVVPMSFGPQGPELSIALIPVAEMTIEDTWNPAGVRASASRTLIAEDVFVPHHRLRPMRPPADEQGPGEALYQASVSGVGSVGTVAPQLGAAEAVLELVMEQSRGRRVAMFGIADQSEHPGFQMRVAEAAVKIQAGWLLTREAAAGLDAAATTGEVPSAEAQGWNRMAPTWASLQAYEAVESLMSESGASAFMDGSPLQRMWRDVGLAHRHAAYRLDPVKELHGRALLGKGPAH